MNSTRPGLQAGAAARLGAMAGDLLRDTISSTTQVASRVGELMSVAQASLPLSAVGQPTKRSVPCCPPVEECPPQCILEIDRRAHPGEVILVRFRIRNGTSHTRSHHLGIRPMVDDRQQLAPTQPTLDATQVTVAPQQSVLVEMRIDLTATGYSIGQQYEATIVVRERDVNQNICFRLILEQDRDIPEATPYDEKDLQRHFVSWHYHFYCDERPARISIQRDASSSEKEEREASPRGK